MAGKSLIPTVLVILVAWTIVAVTMVASHNNGQRHKAESYRLIQENLAKNGVQYFTLSGEPIEVAVDLQIDPRTGQSRN